MDRAAIIEFINANLACHLATIDGTVPKVRGIMPYRADDQGILFHTGTFKDLYRQLIANPAVELCFANPKTFTQLRVSGRVVLVEDQNLKEEVVQARPFLKDIMKDDDFAGLAVFRVVDLKTTVWSMKNNLQPTQYQAW
jgi:uncharacterized pyridoxamine 5'-phosphate oxidase family protein